MDALGHRQKDPLARKPRAQERPAALLGQRQLDTDAINHELHLGLLLHHAEQGVQILPKNRPPLCRAPSTRATLRGS